MNKQTIFFIAAVVIQGLILAAIPAKKVYTRATGRDVVLKVAPVDPYDILKGYYVTLGYDISRPELFSNVTTPQFQKGQTLYAIVEQQSDGIWTPVALEQALPADLPANRAALRGNWNGWRIIYGIEEFSIPEGKREVIGEDLNQHREAARVEVKVDASGNAALVRLLIEDRIYQ